MTRQFSGRRLREARVAAGVTTEHLAIFTRRSAYSIHEYERGRVCPPLHVAALLAAALGCTIDDFMDKPDSPVAVTA